MSHAHSYPQPTDYPQQPIYQQTVYNAPAPTYTYAPASQPYGKPRGTSRTVFSVLASVLVVVGFLVTLLGAVLPFLKRGRSLNLVHANLGAGLLVMFVAFLAAVLIIIAVLSARNNATVSRIFALLGGLSGVFLIVFTLVNLFGADAQHIVDAGGSRAVGGVLLVIGGILATLCGILAFLASISSVSLVDASDKEAATMPDTTPNDVSISEPAQAPVPTQQM